MNEFAHGKGETQFSKLAFNLNPIIALTVWYLILGSGLVLLPTEDLKQAIVSFFFRSSTGKASTGGFDDLNDDNLTFASERRVIANLPGSPYPLSENFLIKTLYSAPSGSDGGGMPPNARMRQNFSMTSIS